jgi:hypothetical protein
VNGDCEGAAKLPPVAATNYVDALVNRDCKFPRIASTSNVDRLVPRVT